jgi:hypothetical protein
VSRKDKQAIESARAVFAADYFANPIFVNEAFPANISKYYFDFHVFNIIIVPELS